MKFILLNCVNFKSNGITKYGDSFAISIDDLVIVTDFEIEKNKML